MVSHTALVLTVAMLVLISAYVLGGEMPIASLMFVMAGSITQLYWVLQRTLVSRVVKLSRRHSSVVDNSSTNLNSSALTQIARNGILRMLSSLLTAAKILCPHQVRSHLRDVIAVLLFSRLLQSSGLMTPITACQAIPIGFALGVAMKRTLPEDPGIEDHMSVVTFWSKSTSLGALKPHLTQANENPYNYSFWSELVRPTVGADDPIEQISLQPADILSDLYHSLTLM